MSSLFLLIFVSLVFAISVVGQSSWRIFSPQDKSFTIELPRNPIHSKVLDPLNPEDDGKDDFECTKSGESYYLSLGSGSNEDLFSTANYAALLIYDVSGCQRTKQLFYKESERISDFASEDGITIKRSKVTVNGLPGHEIIVRKGGYGRNLIVEANKRIYLLIYKTEVDTPSKEVERIFSTFRPKLVK